MIILTILACLKSELGFCRTYQQTYDMLPSIFQIQKQCMGVQGQFALADWVNKHPGWEIRRWDCAEHGKERTSL